ncbi:uncharacterized protein LOC107272301 [Cephus cinctus]|uniref:Uncharacterized protein LOC107272301 n=1 Tax=Cephus cinctus TaxID=211228 RepID=A0AAJ7C9N5_CEPCN|nr:uncharacterized protein LOC107272301 [Cephus cinctus]
MTTPRTPDQSRQGRLDIDGEGEPEAANGDDIHGQNRGQIVPSDQRQPRVEDVHPIKLPPFWRNIPDLWFAQIESTFENRRIRSDDKKYNLVVESLNADSIRHVSDIIRRPPAAGIYEALKTTLVDRLTDSRERQIQTFLNELQLADKRPSQLLREMREFGGEVVHDDFLRSRFIQCMPSGIRAFLGGSSDLTLTKLADTADRLLESCGNSFVMAVDRQPPRATTSSSDSSIAGRLTLVEKSIERMLTVMDKLVTKMDNLHVGKPRNDINNNGDNDGTGYNQQRSRSRSRINQNQYHDGICYYHGRYGADAIHCLQPLTVLPARLAAGQRKPSALKLHATNSTEIATYGTRLLQLDLRLRRPFRWLFIVAEVQSHIIGADFLGKFGLLIDIQNRQLIDSLTGLTTKGTLFTTPVHSISTISEHSTGPGTSATVEHHIETTGPPIPQKPRRLVGEKLEVLRKELQYLFEKGMIRPSKSPWASPIHIAKKPSGDWRCCGDFRALNAKTIPLAPDDVQKTAITTPLGQFEDLVMPFGLRNASQTFRRFMDSIFRDLDFVIVYIDDILVASESPAEHMEHLKQF